MTWRLLYVRPQSENRYHANLAERGLTAYVPKEIIWRGLGHRRQPAAKPLLPGYVFADLTDEQLADVAHLPEVIYIVREGDRPGVVPARFINGLRDAEAKGEWDRTRKERQRAKRYGKPLSEGEAFEVITGPWAGHAGTIAKPLGSKRAEVVLSLFGHDFTVTMSFADMRVILAEREPEAA